MASSSTAPLPVVVSHAGSTVAMEKCCRPYISFRKKPLLYLHKNFSSHLMSNGRDGKLVKWFSDSLAEEVNGGFFHVGVDAMSSDAAMVEEGVKNLADVTELKKGKAALDRRRPLRLLDVQNLGENKKGYEICTAISLLKQMASTRLVETADAHFRLNIDPKYNDQQLKATVNMPKGIGSTVKLAVLAQGELLDQARNEGADLVGGEDLIEQIHQGFVDFDKVIASPDIMPKVYKLGDILGPRGLMPDPESGTVTYDIQKAVAELKKMKVEYRADKTGMVHLTFGKANFVEEDLRVNLLAAIKSVEKNKPSGAKEVYWKSAYICSSMGPSIRLNLKEMLTHRLPLDVISLL